MFEENTDLSPDLEWMLQSTQVDDGTLIEALARKYYQPIYRLALTWLTYPEEAHQAAQETFVQVFFEAENYRGETKIGDLLLNILSGICYQRKLSFEVHRFLNPKLIRSSRSRQSKEILNPHQIEQVIHKIKIQVRSQRAAKTQRLVYQVLGLIVLVILVALTLFQLIAIASLP
jgi:hypothetical protein